MTTRSILSSSIVVLALILATAPTFAEKLEGKETPGEILTRSTAEDWRAFDPDYLLVINLERGRVVVVLSEKLAATHTAQMKALAREGFYDGLSFYRVIDGFVAQGGDVFETREVKTAEKSLPAMFDEPISSEMNFTPMKDVDGYAPSVGHIDSEAVGVDPAAGKVWKLHCTGAMAMARGIDPDTGGTEVYIALQPQRYLDRNLTVFGNVVSGMEHLQALRRVAPAEKEGDDLGEKILSMRVASDLDEADRPAFEILRSDRPIFSDYIESRRNRPSEFFYFRPDHVDVCALIVPVRPIAAE